MLNPTDTRLDRIAHDLGNLIEGYDFVLHQGVHPELRSVLHRQRQQLEHQYHELQHFAHVGEPQGRQQPYYEPRREPERHYNWQAVNRAPWQTPH